MVKLQMKLIPDGLEHVIDFKFESDDVLICSGPKCGTAWIQQIVHSLRSRGNMDFEEIVEVSPMLEFGTNSAFPSLNTPQRFPPRMFITHLMWDIAPRVPGKQICLTSDSSFAKQVTQCLCDCVMQGTR